MAYCPKCDCDVAVNDDGAFQCPHGIKPNNSAVIPQSSDEYQAMMTTGSNEEPDRE